MLRLVTGTHDSRFAAAIVMAAVIGAAPGRVFAQDVETRPWSEILLVVGYDVGRAPRAATQTIGQSAVFAGLAGLGSRENRGRRIRGTCQFPVASCQFKTGTVLEVAPRNSF